MEMVLPKNAAIYGILEALRGKGKGLASGSGGSAGSNLAILGDISNTIERSKIQSIRPLQVSTSIGQRLIFIPGAIRQRLFTSAMSAAGETL